MREIDPHRSSLNIFLADVDIGGQGRNRLSLTLAVSHGGLYTIRIIEYPSVSRATGNYDIASIERKSSAIH